MGKVPQHQLKGCAGAKALNQIVFGSFHVAQLETFPKLYSVCCCVQLLFWKTAFFLALSKVYS